MEETIKGTWEEVFQRNEAVENFARFHEGLSETIHLWAQIIQALDRAEQFELCWRLANIQPDALYIDKAYA